MRKQLGQAPSGATDTATKGYVDTAITASYTASATITGKTINLASNTVTGVPWCPEMVCNSGAIVNGYNDMPGGISVEGGPNATGIYIDSVLLRIGDLTQTNPGGSLTCDIYAGTATTQGSLVTSLTLAISNNNVTSTLGSPYSVAANGVVRAYFTLGSSTLASAVHVQLRGRYKG